MKSTADHTLGGESFASGTLREFRAVLARVTDTLDRGDSTQSATAPLAVFIQQRVACSVVSFWSLIAQDGHAVMSRIGGYDAVADAVLEDELVRPAAEFNLKALAEAAICIVPLQGPPDAAMEPAADESFIPACIDATIAANGQTFGIIRCEFHGPHRPWKLAETTLLRSFAGEIALRRARRRAKRN